MTRSINENANGTFGNSRLASDADSDVLLYSLDNTPHRDDADGMARFSINTNSGQLSASKGLNFEAAADEAE